jgi:hypothetical protein
MGVLTEQSRIHAPLALERTTLLLKPSTLPPLYSLYQRDKRAALWESTVPEFIDTVFAKTSPKRSFSVIENERFRLVSEKTGSINSGTGSISAHDGWEGGRRVWSHGVYIRKGADSTLMTERVFITEGRVQLGNS